MSMRYQAGIVLPGYNALKVTNAPTIGTATAGIANCASVAFTAPACVGGGAISAYTVFANCGIKATTGASSPLVVTGLTTGAAYTFKAIATNVYGPSYPSASSNSITAAVQTCATYATAGTYSWIAPTGVTSVAAVVVGGGGGGAKRFYCANSCAWRGSGGNGAVLRYKNAYSVTPGSSYTVVVGAGGAGGTVQCCSGPIGSSSYFVSATTVKATGGGDYGGVNYGCGGSSYGGFGGGCTGNIGGGGGGGGGGYGVSVAGSGDGASRNDPCGAKAGANGGAGGGGTYGRPGVSSTLGAAGGGGVGIFGQGSNGAAGATGTGGGGGSSGAIGGTPASYNGAAGGAYGGGGGSSNGCAPAGRVGGAGGVGAVRIVWAGGARGTPSFPSTNVGA